MGPCGDELGGGNGLAWLKPEQAKQVVGPQQLLNPRRPLPTAQTRDPLTVIQQRQLPSEAGGRILVHRQVTPYRPWSGRERQLLYGSAALRAVIVKITSR